MVPAMEPTAIPEVPAGNQSSEYKLTIAGVVVTVLFGLVGLVHPGFKPSKEVQDLAVTDVGVVLPILIGWYQHGRAKIKTAAIQAGAGVAAATVAAQATTAAANIAASPDTKGK
jgi:hypothetical protein